MNTTAADIAAILDAAADYIDQYGWCQGGMYEAQPSSRHPRACAVGAIRVAANDPVHLAFPFDDVVNQRVPDFENLCVPEVKDAEPRQRLRLITAAVGYLADQIPRDDPEREDADIVDIVGYWNDHSNAAAVIAELHDAARAYRTRWAA